MSPPAVDQDGAAVHSEPPVPDVAPNAHGSTPEGQAGGAATYSQTRSHKVEPSEEAPQSQGFLGMMDRVFEGMGQALSVRKLSFFLLSALAAFVVCGLLVRIGFAIGVGTGIVTLFITMLIAVGLSGAIAGGVAYLAVEEGQGRSCRLVDVFTFCGQQFVALFFGAILLAVGVTLAGALANGLVALFNLSRTVGSLLGSVLFLPQVVVNAALVVLCLVGVLVPCAVAVEGVGPILAIRRLVTILIQRPGGLLLQFAITLYFGVMMLCVLGFLAVVSLGPTLATNGPSLGGLPMPFPPSFDDQEIGLSGLSSGDDLGGFGFPGMESDPFSGLSSPRSRPEPAVSAGKWGDWLRYLGVGVVFIAVLAFPVVFWICAFARYYESLVPSFEPSVPATPPPLSPPPLPKADVGRV